MFQRELIWLLILFNAMRECHTFKQKISKDIVDGTTIKFCEYKLLKMLPKSTFMDMEACLKCSCSTKTLNCKPISVPGCDEKPGGLVTQNPFSKKWTKMVDGLIKQKFTSNFRILQVKTAVVAGTNTYIWLLVKDRLCDLTIFENFDGKREITTDSCFYW